MQIPTGHLTPEQEYTQLPALAKAAVTARLDEIAYDMDRTYGSKRAAERLDVSQQLVIRRRNNHKEKLMWTVPHTLPVIHEDLDKIADAPAGTLWWVKVVEPETAKATRVYVMRGDEGWLGYECAASWHRTDDDELAEGVRLATGIAQVLAAEVPALDKVGRETAEGYSIGGGQGKSAMAHRSRTAAVMWEWIKGRAPGPSGLDRAAALAWAQDVMRGDLSGPASLL